MFLNPSADFGRGRSWLRNALNEHSLEKYLSVILADDDGLQSTSSSSSTSARRKFYHDWALLLDPQRAPLLISTTRPLSGVLFALSIDRADLDVEEGEGGTLVARDSSLKSGTTEEARLKPVKKQSIGTSSGGNSGGGVQAALVKSRKKKITTTVVTINDEEEEDLESSDLETLNGDADLYARSAPVPSFMKLAATASSSNLEHGRTPPPPPSKLISSPSEAGALKTSTMVLYPLYDNDHEGGGSSLSAADFCDSPTPTNNTTSESITDGDQQQQSKTSGGGDLAATNRRLQERLDFLQLEKEKILRDNSLLKIQLNKYLAALELLKYNHSRGGEAGGETSSSSNSNNRREDGGTSSGDNEVEVYERKLVQVSEMHGELVEFNEHLYRVIQQKDSIIGRLRDELVELRGPVRKSFFFVIKCFLTYQQLINSFPTTTTS